MVYSRGGCFSDCDLMFPTVELLELHDHSTAEQHNCEFCSKQFLNLFVLINHVNGDHRDLIQDVWMSCDEVRL